MGTLLLNHHENIPEPLKFYKHIGIYGYKKSFNKTTPQETNVSERLEKLETMLRVRNGYRIKMIEINTNQLLIQLKIWEERKKIH